MKKRTTWTMADQPSGLRISVMKSMAGKDTIFIDLWGNSIGSCSIKRAKYLANFLRKAADRLEN